MNTTLPCRKILVKQIIESKLFSNVGSTIKGPLQEEHAVELDSGRFYCYTKVWIEGEVIDVDDSSTLEEFEEKDEDRKEFHILKISDGTGSINVYISKIMKQRNKLYGSDFRKGSNLMVTGAIVRQMDFKEPLIKAMRFFELPNLSRGKWLAEVAYIQHYLSV